MDMIEANEIKIGILTYIKRRFEKEVTVSKGIIFSHTSINRFIIGGNLRGIIFTDNQGVCADLLNQNTEYDYINPKGNISSPIIGVSSNTNLGPLLNHMGLEKISISSLECICKDTLMCRRWLKEYSESFGLTISSFGPLQIMRPLRSVEGCIPSDIGKIIFDAQGASKRLSLSMREEKLSRLYNPHYSREE